MTTVNAGLAWKRLCIVTNTIGIEMRYQAWTKTASQMKRQHRAEADKVLNRAMVMIVSVEIRYPIRIQEDPMH